MSGPTATQTIKLSWELPFPPAKVWRGLTDPKLLARWLMDNDMQPELGRRFAFRQQPTPYWNGVVDCEVKELEPQRRLSYSWRSDLGATKLDTVVTWTLTATDSGGTLLELEHSGFVPSNAFAFGGAKTGWQQKVGEAMVKALADAST